MAAQEIGSLYLGLGFDTAVFDRQIVQIPQKVSQATQAITKGFSGASKEIDNFQKSSGATRAGLQNLSFQLNDIGTSLASGSSPFRVLAQQGGQIVQVFQQAGFRNIATAIVGMVTPMRALAVGAVAAGAAFGGLLLRAQSNTEQLRQLNLVLERTGRLASSIDIGGENVRLRAVGISGSLAQTQRLAAGRNPQIIPGAATERLQVLGANLGAARGIGPAAGYAELLQATNAGVEATLRLAVAEKALTGEQASALSMSARRTGGLKEQEQALAALERQLKNAAKDAMGPMAELTNTLAGAWDKMLDSMSKTSIVQGARDAIIDMMKQIGAAASGETVTSPTPTNLLGTGINLQAANRSVRQAIGGAARFVWNQLPDWGNPAANQAELTAALNSRGGTPYVPPPPTFAERMGATPPGAALSAAQAGFGIGGAIRGGGGAGAGLGVSGDLRGDFLVGRNQQQVKEVTDAIARQREAIAAATRAARLYNIEQQADIAAEAARQRIREIPGSTPDEQEAAATAAAAGERAKFNIELRKENTLTSMRIASERKVAQAMLESEGAAVRLNAAEQAKIETLQRGGSVAMRTQQALEARSAAAETQLAQGVVGGRKDIEEAQLRVSLLGQSTEYIERQIALLRVRQQVEAAGVPVAKEVVDARIAGVNALQDELDLLARQRRVMDTLKEVAGVFENAFGRAFDSIADGTFKIRKFLGDLLKDLGKTLASSAFRRLLGGDSGDSGILGSLVGRLFPSLLGLGSGGGIGADYGGGGELGVAASPGFATGGSFQVGGSGSIDSQLVAFRASPGEMVQVTPANSNDAGGRGEVIHINLNPSEGWVSGIADQRIVTRSGQIIEVAVKQSQRTVQRNFAGMSAEAQARQL